MPRIFGFFDYQERLSASVVGTMIGTAGLRQSCRHATNFSETCVAWIVNSCWDDLVSNATVAYDVGTVVCEFASDRAPGGGS